MSAFRALAERERAHSGWWIVLQSTSNHIINLLMATSRVPVQRQRKRWADVCSAHLHSSLQEEKYPKPVAYMQCKSYWMGT